MARVYNRHDFLKKAMVNFISSLDFSAGQFVDYIDETDPKAFKDFYNKKKRTSRLVTTKDFPEYTDKSFNSPDALKKDSLLRFLFHAEIPIDDALRYVHESDFGKLVQLHYTVKGTLDKSESKASKTEPEEDPEAAERKKLKNKKKKDRKKEKKRAAQAGGDAEKEESEPETEEKEHCEVYHPN